jgi:tetratricopeptide (TPR) repeat protein
MQLDLYCPKCKFISPSAHNRVTEAFIEDLHRRGHVAYTEKSYEKASSSMKVIIKLQPNNPGAVELLQKIESEQYSLEHLLAEARVAFQNRRFKKAASLANDVNKVHPGHPEAEEILKQSRVELEDVAALEAEVSEFVSQGEYATARASLEQIVQILPDSDKHQTQLIRIKEKLSNFDKRYFKEAGQGFQVDTGGEGSRRSR